MTRQLVAVDLFAGCGGLSHGLRAAGIRIAGGVEVEEEAAATFRKNHPSATILTKDIRAVVAQDLLAMSEDGVIDLIVGCAPCQGFCSLTRKLSREDPRNDLLLEMARLVEGVKPAAVMMENVPGLNTLGGNILGEFIQRLKAAGYYPQTTIAQMADYGVPQYRRRLVLLAGKGFAIPLPEPTHARDGRSENGLKPWRNLQEAIGKSPWPVTLSRARRRGGPRTFNWHVVRNLQPQTRARLRAAVPGKTWLSVDESIRPKCHQDGYKGFTNVYQRMAWDQVSVTITSGCTTPCKGRFGHPDRRRTTISVREAALLQTFPRSYRFASDHIDVVCEMIGNAVPPLFARAVGKQIYQSLREHFATLEGRS